MGNEVAERSLEQASGQNQKPATTGTQPSTWSEARRHWRAQGRAHTGASVPARRRRRLDWLQPLLERYLGSNPWVVLSGAFLAWGGAVVLVLSLLEVIRL